ncbi:hypothetical protein WICPIJ_000403 [Wickerhamomyces pijperi]|uniref:SPS-sensor component PTR3 n=1 Tax=Wickerhamomyces pijperi TaxID=599730 RepID=A0A9P8QGR8_WICPI|nr:hypothetical protein WICPIJ_000403 [Wickerhamomyces pijperi]
MALADIDLSTEIKEILTLPKDIKQDGTIIRDVVKDSVMLSLCGCVMSEELVHRLKQLKYSECPICLHHSIDYKFHSVAELRKLSDLLKRLENNQETITPHTSTESNPCVDLQEKEKKQRKKTQAASTAPAATEAMSYNISSGFSDAHSMNRPKTNQNLLSLFYKVANNIQTDTGETEVLLSDGDDDFGSTSENQQTIFKNESVIVGPNEIKLEKGSSTSTTEFTANQIPNSRNYYPSLASTESSKEANKEKLFVRNFPRLKKQFQFHTSSTKFLHFSKTRNFINNAISSNCRYFALLTPTLFKVYETNGVYKPKLLFCGNKFGETGTDMNNLKKDFSQLYQYYDASELFSRFAHWEFLYCKITDKFLVITGTTGILMIYSMKDLGKPVYVYFSSFPIRCVSISQDSKIVAYGITGKDRINNSEQTLIVLHKLGLSTDPQSLHEIVKVDPITITFPYKDPINKISFSKDSRYLTCSTAIESRFLIISIKDPFSPKLIMKSIKSIDTSLESEGITDLQLFPNNRYMIVTSVGFNSPSIIIDNNISTINGLQTVARPKLILKLNELGSNLHQCAISPRDDSIAVIDKNGVVYLITMNKINSTDFDNINSKKLFAIDQVSNSFSIKESASLAWDENGYRLYIVDRKGILYVNDFIAGETNSESLVKSRIIT